MPRVRNRWVLLTGAALLAAALIGGMVASSRPLTTSAKALPHYLAAPGSERDEAAGLAQLDTYWSDRLTYPTGRFNPAWLRRAAAQDALVERGIPNGRARMTSARTSAGAATSESTIDDINGFVSLGPKPERMTGCTGCYDYSTTSGRINAIVVDPTTTTNGSIVAYAASVGGGVWKTTNCCSNSTAWNIVTDDPLLSTISIDTLAIDPNDHLTIYAGTGDLNFGSFSMGSQGILKSTDGGATWTLLGAGVFAPAYTEPAGQFPQYDAVGKVRVDPNDGNRIVAGTKKGLFLSYDGGAGWTGPCLTNGFAGQRQDTTGLELTNIGGGVTRIVAAVGTRGYATTVQYDLGKNGSNGIYRAMMPASGCPVFTSIAGNANGFVYGVQTNGAPYSTGASMNAGSGLPYGGLGVGNQLGRIDIAVAPSDPNVIYAQVQSIAANSSAGCANAAGCQLGAWATTDGGGTWNYMTGSSGASLRSCSSGPASSTPGSGDYAQNWYDQGVAVDPNNPDRVFFDTFDVWLATRAGVAWYDVTCGYSGASPKPVHVDQHALAFVRGSSSILLLGNDGGTHAATNADAALPELVRPTWFNMDTGFSTIEFYSGDISGNFATSANPQAAGGAQDNAPSVVGYSGYPTGPAQWQMTVGGDGFYARIDPVGTGSSLRFWVGNNSGHLNRCTSNCLAGGSGYSDRTGGWTADTQSFILPFDLFHGGISGGDDCQTAGATTGCGHLVAGTTRVWETVTGAATTPTWYVTNNPAAQNMTKMTLGNRSFINQVKYSPKYQSVAMAGTNDANAWIGFNLGTGVANKANWVNVSGGNAVLPNRPVLGIALDPSVAAANTPIGYAAVGGFNANTPATPGHVFRLVCAADCVSFAWTDKTGNLPDIPVDSIIVNPRFPQQVFAGTDFGLYFTNDITASSPTWFRFQKGLPNVMIWDMQIDRGSTTLSVWTRSRGAYVWTLPDAPVRQRQTIEFGALADKTYGDPDFTVSASASSGLPVSFAAQGPCTVSDNSVHIGGAGSCTITASQAGNVDYAPAPDVSQTFAIAQAPLTITAQDRSKLYGLNVPLGKTAFTSAGLVNGDSVSEVTLSSAGAEGAAAVGRYAIVPSAAVGTNVASYSITYVNGTLTVYLSGIVGLDSVSVGGSNVVVDSFDSSAGAYGTANAGSAALLLSNGTITLNRTKVFGSVRSAQGSVTLKDGASVTGDVTAGTTISGGTIGGTATAKSPAAKIVAPAVAACSPFSSAAGISGKYTYDAKRGDLTVSGGNTATLANGSYCFHKVTLSGGATLRVNGAVTVRLTGQLTAGDGKIVNSTNVPANLQIASSYAGDGVTLSGGPGMYLSLYAPASAVKLTGGMPVHGAVLGKTLTVTGDSVHYDVRLLTAWASYLGL
jgi:hypothetical protein